MISQFISKENKFSISPLKIQFCNFLTSVGAAKSMFYSVLRPATIYSGHNYFS